MWTILLGFIISGAGVWMILKTEWIIANFGANAWAEQHLGTEGGSRIFYKLIGLGIILLGFLLITGLLEPLARNTLSPIIGE